MTQKTSATTISKLFYPLVSSVRQNQLLLRNLVKNEFKQRYLGSHLGFLWAFIQPLVTVLIFWFVFQVGFKSQPVNNVPFLLWLVVGMFPWFLIAEIISSATNSILDNGYLVKKIVFNVSLLPLIKIFSALIVHLFFVCFTFVLFYIYGFKYDHHWLQISYYLISVVALTLGISYITASVIIFVRDVGQFVAMMLQFGFWLTPIFWSISMVPEKYQIFVRLNPIVYIIEGYRDSLINQVWFWEKPMITLYFWSFTLITFFIGKTTFKRLRPHFADVI